MTETIWFLVVGGVLIFMGLASSTFKQLPISSAMVYLAIGFGLGPFGIGLLKIDLLGYAIKEARLYHNLTQEQLGKLIGVQKAQISKLENNFTNARFDTVIKVFNALHAKVNFKVQLPKRKLVVA